MTSSPKMTSHEKILYFLIDLMLLDNRGKFHHFPTKNPNFTAGGAFRPPPPAITDPLNSPAIIGLKGNCSPKFTPLFIA